MAVLRTIARYDAPNSQAEVYNGFGMAPVGGIVSWIPGYYGGAANTGYAKMLGATDDAAGANGYSLPFGWLVCNGAVLSDTISPLYDPAFPTRCLPNLSDDRFLNGVGPVVGAAPQLGGTSQGGVNTMATHIHAQSGTCAGQSGISTSVTRSLSGGSSSSSTTNHRHRSGDNVGTYLVISGTGWNGATGSGDAQGQPAQNYTTGGMRQLTTHSHTFTGSTDISHTHSGTLAVSGTAGGGLSVILNTTENRPKYLKCFYIMRVK